MSESDHLNYFIDPTVYWSTTIDNNNNCKLLAFDFAVYYGSLLLLLPEGDVTTYICSI